MGVPPAPSPPAPWPVGAAGGRESRPKWRGVLGRGLTRMRISPRRVSGGGGFRHGVPLGLGAHPTRTAGAAPGHLTNRALRAVVFLALPTPAPSAPPRLLPARPLCPLVTRGPSCVPCCSGARRPWTWPAKRTRPTSSHSSSRAASQLSSLCPRPLSPPACPARPLPAVLWAVLPVVPPSPCPLYL